MNKTKRIDTMPTTSTIGLIVRRPRFLSSLSTGRHWMWFRKKMNHLHSKEGDRPHLHKEGNQPRLHKRNEYQPRQALDVLHSKRLHRLPPIVGQDRPRVLRPARAAHSRGANKWPTLKVFLVSLRQLLGLNSKYSIGPNHRYSGQPSSRLDDQPSSLPGSQPSSQCIQVLHTAYDVAGVQTPQPRKRVTTISAFARAQKNSHRHIPMFINC